MTKEVTKTNVKIVKMEVVDGVPVMTPLEDQVLIGNVSLEKAQRAMRKQFGDMVTVIGVEPETLTYQMKVEDFIKYAEVKDSESQD